MSSDSSFASRKTALAGATRAASSARRAASAEHVLVHVEDVDERLGGEQAQLADRFEVDGCRGERRPGIQRLLRFDRGLEHDRLDPLGLEFLLVAGDRLLEGLQVGEHELGVDRLEVALGVDAAVDVHDVGVGEAAHDLARSRRPRGCWRGTCCRAPPPRSRPSRCRRCRRTTPGAGRMRSLVKISASTFSRGSGRLTTPTFGSIVANG